MSDLKKKPAPGAPTKALTGVKRTLKGSVQLAPVPAVLVSCADGDVTESYLRDERKQIVHRALGRLIDSHREVLWLVYFENLSVKEAAEVLGKSPHAAESLIHRARLSMKAELEKEGITHEDL